MKQYRFLINIRTNILNYREAFFTKKRTVAVLKKPHWFTYFPKHRVLHIWHNKFLLLWYTKTKSILQIITALSISILFLNVISFITSIFWSPNHICPHSFYYLKNSQKLTQKWQFLFSKKTFHSIQIWNLSAADAASESAQRPITADLALVSFVSAMIFCLQKQFKPISFQRFWLWNVVF